MSALDAARQAAATPVAEGPPKFTFQNPGDEVYGQVAVARFGITTPHGEGHLIELNDHQHGLITVWLSNVQLQAGVVEGRNQLARPVHPGDIVYIRFDSTEPRPGGKTLKNFSINVAEGETAPPVQQAQQQPAPQYAPQPQVQPQQAPPAPPQQGGFPTPV